MNEQLLQATGQIATLQASLELAQKRVEQNTELTAAGAGPRFDLEQAQTNVREFTAQIATARAAEQQVREKLSGRVNGELSAVAEVRSQIATAQAAVKVAQAQAETTRGKIDNARYDLEQTTVISPGNGTMVNVNLRPGYFVGGIAFSEVMTFVDTEYQIFALFGQNELHQVEAGKRSGDCARHNAGPHRQGACGFGDLGTGARADGRDRQSAIDGLRPRRRVGSPSSSLSPRHDNALFLAAGARGTAAIYTEHLTMIHLVRKVILRMSSYFGYIISPHLH